MGSCRCYGWGRVHLRSSFSTCLESMTYLKWISASCVPPTFLISIKASRPTESRLNSDRASSLGYPSLQAGPQYTRTEMQGKWRARDKASDRATELRRSRDRVCRYAHGGSQQCCVGLSRLYVIGAPCSMPSSSLGTMATDSAF